MKKIQKNDLRLEKEVITALTADDQTGLKGGATIGAGCVYAPSTPGYTCNSNNTCGESVCIPCSGPNKSCPVYDCKPELSGVCNTTVQPASYPNATCDLQCFNPIVTKINC